MGKTVVITGVPGVGKTTVINGALAALEKEGVSYQSINFGTFMFEVASQEGIASDRDEMRRLDQDVQRRLQRSAAQGIAQIEGNIIVDTHCTVSTPKGYLAGLPEWVLRELKPDIFVLVETDEDQILSRRLSDASRVRDMDGYMGIRDHQQFNRSIAASYAMYSGCTVKIVRNADFLLDKAVADMVEILR
ncbi:MAG: adenylate kinase [Methanomicrobiales archaeon]|nr:adenylate kinase [Methanomicrobiales archaeon]